MSPRIAHVDSVAFLRQMPQLRSLLLHTIIVDDLDYSPILELQNLEAVAVMKARGMRPAWDNSPPWHRGRGDWRPVVGPVRGYPRCAGRWHPVPAIGDAPIRTVTHGPHSV